MDRDRPDEVACSDVPQFDRPVVTRRHHELGVELEAGDGTLVLVRACSIHKEYFQGVFTRSISKDYSQGVFTRSIHKEYSLVVLKRNRQWGGKMICDIEHWAC